MSSKDASDFVELYAQAIDSARCAGLIAGFERSGLARRRATGGGVDVTAKISWNI